MTTNLKLKIGLLVGMILFSIMVVVPSFYPDKEKEKLPQWWTKYLAPEGFKRGLDLQGGMHLVLRVNLDKAVENSIDLAAKDLTEALSSRGVAAVRLQSGDTKKAILTLPNTNAVETARSVIKEDFPNLNIQVESEAGSFPRLILALTDDEVSFIKKNAVDQSLEIIRNRIDQFGVTEPVIIRQGDNEIVVQLPGIKDPQRAIDLIGKTAQLEFKLVADSGGLDLRKLIDEAEKSGRWKEDQDPRILNAALQGRLPEGTEILFEKKVDPQTKQTLDIPILLHSQVLMTGEMVKNAQVRIGGNFNEPYVSIDLTDRGGREFANITENNVGKQLAIVLDHVVRSAPVIRDKILGGRAQITGSFTHKEATDLAIVLRVGALPAPVDIIQKMTVGPSLGQDSIHKGLISGLFGALIVLVFMVIYYRLSGVIADFALLLNILFLFVGLAMLSATLTLPGIAGIILSIGMGVDANVLIFERMREEFALGKSVKAGVDSGFDKAFWSIVDSQVTTLITALALFLFGTGPIKGFAVTLTLGILCNLFAVLFCTRLVYETLYSKRLLNELKFMAVLHKPNFDFMRLRKFTFTVSAILVLFGLLSFVEILRGDANLGVDFTGGALLQYKADKPFQLQEVRSALEKNGWTGLNPQPVAGENRLIIKVKKAEEKVSELGDQITSVLTKEMADRHFTLESESDIGSSISSMLRNKAIEAILISLAGVIIYLALRFDLSFGIAAAAATFHDVLAVLGICWVFDIEITLLIITALLTLAGYSLNDTVVIFDRIRENMQKHPDLDITTILNNSINQTLSRSIITSLTTVLVLVALFFFGGSAIHDFSFALLIGIIIGTYSSIYIASPLLSLWPHNKE